MDRIAELLKLKHLFNHSYQITDPANIHIKEIGEPYSKHINGTVEYVASGNHGCIYRISLLDKKTAYAFKIIPFSSKDSADPHNLLRSEHVEATISNAMNSLITNHVTPCLKTYIASVTHTGIPKLTANDTHVSSFIQSRKDKLLNYSIVIVTEWVDGVDLCQYLSTAVINFGSNEWRNMLFQLVYTLAAIQKFYAGFKHNDLSCNNILVKTSTHEDAMRSVYTIDHKNFYLLPNAGFQTILTDFDFAIMPKHGVYNLKLDREWCKLYNITDERNDYYDLHYMFNDMIVILQEMQVYKYLPVDVRLFIEDVVPADYRGITGKHVKYSRLTRNDVTVITPANLIAHKFFEPLRVETPAKMESNLIIYGLVKYLT